LKAKVKTIADLKEEVNKLATEKRAMDGELAELRPLTLHVSELDRLRKELEERDSELSRAREESKRKALTSNWPWRS